MILFSHPTGSTMSRHSLETIYESNLLYQYWTSIGVSQKSILYTCLPSFIKGILKNRSYNIPSEKISNKWYPEIMRLVSQKIGISKWVEHEKGIFCSDAIFTSHDIHVARYIHKHRSSISAVYGYEDSCLDTFRVAKMYGIKCIYELPIAYWEHSQAILKEEALRYPLWEPTLLGNRDSFQKNKRKTSEIQLADSILCPSLFVKQSIPPAIAQKTPIYIIPYGAPPTRKLLEKPSSSTLRVLFVGSLSQRKGLADIFAALKILNRKDIKLTVLGQPILPLDFYYKQYPYFTYESPRNNAGILDCMMTHDILVLPSLVEGRAIVQLEALSCGLPLIITHNTGAQDLIEEGKTGFLVPLRSPTALAEKIAWMADHKKDLPAMSKMARQKAMDNSWIQFKEQLEKVLIQEIG